MSVIVERPKKKVYGIHHHSDSPEFMFSGELITSEAYLNMKVNEPWKNSEFILKDMETGEKLVSAKKDPIYFNTAKPLKVYRRHIATSRRRNLGDKTAVIPVGHPVQARMKLSNGFFDKAELPEDDSRFTFEPDEYLGELPAGSVRLSQGFQSKVSSRVYWEVELKAPKSSDLIHATLDIYKVYGNSAPHPLNRENELVFQKSFDELPEVGGKDIRITDGGEGIGSFFATYKMKAFLTLQNAAGNICCHTFEMPLKPVDPAKGSAGVDAK